MAFKFCTCHVNGRFCHLPLHASLDPGILGLQIFQCPLGHRTYEAVADSAAQQTQGHIIRFRRLGEDGTWHFWRACPDWPTSEFFEASAISGTLCTRCLAEF